MYRFASSIPSTWWRDLTLILITPHCTSPHEKWYSFIGVGNLFPLSGCIEFRWRASWHISTGAESTENLCDFISHKNTARRMMLNKVTVLNCPRIIWGHTRKLTYLWRSFRMFHDYVWALRLFDHFNTPRRNNTYNGLLYILPLSTAGCTS